MAIVWKKLVDNNIYEIRTAGASTRLYTNGVFHSQWNPNRPFSGNIWDLLAIPALFVDAKKINRVLILGVGGGTVIRLLKTLIHPCHMIGIELNPVHLEIARKFFGVIKSNHLKLIQDDAIDWIKSYTGEPFDLIIEDLFGDDSGEPVRVIDLDKRWFLTLTKHLSKNGILVVNTINIRHLKKCAFFHDNVINNTFKSAYRFSLPTYENAIGAFFKKNVSNSDRHRNIRNLKDNRIIRSLLSSPYHQVKLK